LSTDQSQLALASLGCSNPLSQNLLNATTQIYALGTVLYTHYAYDLILASLILLAAMLGIALTLSKVRQASPTKIYEQNLRIFKQTIVKHRSIAKQPTLALNLTWCKKKVVSSLLFIGFNMFTFCFCPLERCRKGVQNEPGKRNS
jgi:hypothetical protein